MNKSNAKDYLPLVQALADGKTIQSGQIGGSDRHWVDNLNVQFSNPPAFYRIKPEPKKEWVRFGVDKAGNRIIVDRYTSNEETIKSMPAFLQWLTDRIEYELPE